MSSADVTDILPSGGLWPGAGPVGVVVIGILAVGVVEVPASMRRMRSMGLAPGAGDPSLADRFARGTWAGVVMIRMSGLGEDSVRRAGDHPPLQDRPGL